MSKRERIEIDATIRAIKVAWHGEQMGELRKQARRLARLAEPHTPFAVAAKRKARTA